MRLSLWLRAAPIAILLLLPAFIRAETVVATFADGKGAYAAPVTDVVDAYTGMEGGGWANGWTVGKTGNFSAAHVVYGPEDASYNALVDGNYLAYKVNTSSSSGQYAAIHRDYTGLDGVDPTLDHSIEFTVRIEENLANNRFTNANDRYEIHDRAAYGSTGTYFQYSSGFSTWGISMTGDVKKWLIRNTTYDEFGVATFSDVNTDVALAQGQALTFHLDFDMDDGQNGTYGVVVKNAATSEVLFSGSGYGLGHGATDAAGPYNRETTGRLVFATMASNTSSEGVNYRNWGIDAITVAQVPEPGSVVMLLGLLLAGLVWRRKRLSWTPALAWAAILVLPALVHAAEVAATFADGKGSYAYTTSGPVTTDNRVTDVIDAFSGMAGGGWTDGWANPYGGSLSVSYTVLGPGDAGYTQLVDENYLSFKSNTSSSSVRYAAMYRDYTDGIDATADHSIQFTVRIGEDITATKFSGTNDRYEIHDRRDSYTSGGGATHQYTYAPAYDTWGILLRGAWSTPLDPLMADHWVIADWDTDANAGAYIDTGILPAKDVPYTFTLDFHMDEGANGVYDVSIASGGSTVYSGTGFDLGPGAGDTVTPGPFSRETTGRLIFSMGAVNDSSEGTNYRNWSIDDITVSQGASTPLPGDTNNDGFVTDADAATLAAHWLQTELTGGYEVGDFNTDGTVDDRDAAILAAHWVRGTGEGAATVPEPGTLVLLGLGALMLVVRRFRG